MTSRVLMQMENKKDKLFRKIIYFLIFILLLIVATAPGILQIMYRADAQVALGNAKTVRMALQNVAADRYGSGREFYDITYEGGVSEEVRRQVILLSKVPGDFWILQMDELGIEVTSFMYKEGDFRVYYTKEPLVYQVYREESFIQTQFHPQ